MNRKTCVICREPLQLEIYSQDNFPINMSHTTEPESSDIFSTLSFFSCVNCGCVQLKTLIDPVFLYKNSHNITFNTPTWSDHHNKFAEFIQANTSPTDTLFEIGGHSGVLAKKLLESTTPKYYILDICDTSPDISGIEFISGNCETYTYNPNDTIIMSHVFEHLYNPRLFLENLSATGVNSIFISNPNMENWLESGVPSFLHVEHTYYCDSTFINYLMNQYGYVCNKEISFKNHSVFYHFKRGEITVPISIQDRTSVLINTFKSYYNKRDTFFKYLQIDVPFFIFPAGHYGQLAYRSLTSSIHNFICFLDNDPSKINTRVYGTKGDTNNPNMLKDYGANPVTILLIASVYSDEIKRQLLSINNNINFIEFNN